MTHTDKVRAVILKHLAALAEDLGEFEQTTHGQVVFGPVMKMVSVYLDECYKEPTAYNISNLSQGIRQMVKYAG